MFYTDDPEADFRRWDKEQEDARELLPECCECGHKIDDDMCWVFGDEPICDECAERNHRIPTTYLMG